MVCMYTSSLPTNQSAGTIHPTNQLTCGETAGMLVTNTTAGIGEAGRFSAAGDPTDTVATAKPLTEGRMVGATWPGGDGGMAQSQTCTLSMIWGHEDGLAAPPLALTIEKEICTAEEFAGMLKVTLKLAP